MVGQPELGVQTCSVCGEVAGKRCGGCHQVHYCGRDHQRLDWLRHKPLCRPFKVCFDDVLGRHLVATRDIKQGEVVLREAPLLQGPSQVTGPVCLGCLQTISQHNSEPCERCGWPLCRKASCRQAPQHLPECRWTVEKRGTPVKISQFVNPHPSYECVTALRMCYTKLHNPGLWTKLSSLQNHADERRRTQKYQDDSKSVAQFLRRFYKIEDEFSDEEVMDIWGILQVNGHEVPVSTPPHVAVYEAASLLEHNCRPSCSKSFTSTGAVVIRVVQPVPTGGHLSICYTDCLWGTASRQCHLQETKHFTCRCVRCLDPTEFDTYFSALICQQPECGGLVLPKDFCELSPYSAWVCVRCGHSTPDIRVQLGLQEAGEELSTLGSRDLTSSFAFLDKWQSRLHQNHYYLTEVRVALAQRLGQESQAGLQGLSVQQLRQKTDLCRKLLKLLAILAPAECRVLGILNFELHAALAEAARRGLPEDLHQTLMESRGCIEKTIYWLEHEPEVIPEGQLLIQAKLNLTEMDKHLQSVHRLTSSIPAM